MSQARPPERGQDDGGIENEVPQSPNVNQVRDEPVPASHDEPGRPAATRRSEEAAASSAPGGREDQQGESREPACARREPESQGSGR